jgi:NAD(P)-dependent dehydrogenase (short-subunit alcohol dehydrogenase family)
VLTHPRSTTLGSIAQSHKYMWGSAPAYKITKAALNMLTVQYALEYEKEGFIIFAVSPGVRENNSTMRSSRRLQNKRASAWLTNLCYCCVSG